VRFFEESMLEQLHRYTHEIINTLSVWKRLQAVLAIHFYATDFPIKLPLG